MTPSLRCAVIPVYENCLSVDRPEHTPGSCKLARYGAQVSNFKEVSSYVRLRYRSYFNEELFCEDWFFITFQFLFSMALRTYLTKCRNVLCALEMYTFS